MTTLFSTRSLLEKNPCPAWLSLVAISKMKRFYAILIFCALAACKPAANVVPADFLEVAPPLRPKIELFISQYKLQDTGTTLRPNLSNWTAEVKTKYTTSSGETGKPPYSAMLQYLGRKPDADVYSVTITRPVSGGNETFTKEVRFSGEEVEIFKDEEYRIGLRSDSQSEG